MSDSERACVRVLRQIRPGWRRPDIILWRLGPSTWVGYSVGHVADKLVVRMWGDQDQVQRVLCSCVQISILFVGIASEQPSPAVLGPRAGSPPPWHLQPRARDPLPGPLR